MQNWVQQYFFWGGDLVPFVNDHWKVFFDTKFPKGTTGVGP